MSSNLPSTVAVQWPAYPVRVRPVSVLNIADLFRLFLAVWLGTATALISVLALILLVPGIPMALVVRTQEVQQIIREQVDESPKGDSLP